MASACELRRYSVVMAATRGLDMGAGLPAAADAVLEAVGTDDAVGEGDGASGLVPGDALAHDDGGAALQAEQARFLYRGKARLDGFFGLADRNAVALLEQGVVALCLQVGLEEAQTEVERQDGSLD